MFAWHDCIPSSQLAYIRFLTLRRSERKKRRRKEISRRSHPHRHHSRCIGFPGQRLFGYKTCSRFFPKNILHISKATAVSSPASDPSSSYSFSSVFEWERETRVSLQQRERRKKCKRRTEDQKKWKKPQAGISGSQLILISLLARHPDADATSALRSLPSLTHRDREYHFHKIVPQNHHQIITPRLLTINKASSVVGENIWHRNIS